MEASRPPRLLSPFILAEIDYLVTQRIGQRAEMLLLDDVVSGAYRLEAFDAFALSEAREIMQRYADLNVGLADASVVVLAERFNAHDVLTLDTHFRALRAGGGAFRLLPAA